MDIPTAESGLVIEPWGCKRKHSQSINPSLQRQPLWQPSNTTIAKALSKVIKSYKYLCMHIYVCRLNLRTKVVLKLITKKCSSLNIQQGPLHKYVTPKMAVFDPPTHPVTLGHVSLDPPAQPP